MHPAPVALRAQLSTEDWQIHTTGVTCHQNHHDCCGEKLGQATVVGAMPCGFGLAKVHQEYECEITESE